MKKISGLLIFLFSAFLSYGQIPNSATVSNAQTKYQIPNMFATLSAKLPVIDTLNNKATPYVGALTILPTDTLNKDGIPPIYISNGKWWGKLSGGGGGTGVDSVTFPETPNRQICIWSGGFSQCYAIGGYYDSTSYNNDTTYYYHYSNGSFVDSVWIAHTHVFPGIGFGTKDTTYNGLPAQVFSAETHYVTPDSLYYVTLNPDRSIKDSIVYLADGFTNPFCDSVYISADSIWQVALNCDGSIRDSTRWQVVGTDSAIINVVRPLYAPTQDTLRIVQSFLDSVNNVVGGIFAVTELNVGGIRVGNNSLDATNTAFGILANQSMTSGSYNTTMGYGALRLNTSGVGNTAIGATSLNANTTGIQNVAVGPFALLANTSGSNNIGIGNSAAPGNTTGSDNVAIGFRAAYISATPSSVLAIGTNALLSHVTGNNITGIGVGAFYYDSIGSKSIANGPEAGKWYGFDTTHNKSNTGNILIGYRAHPSIANSINQVVIASGNGTTYGGGGSGNNSVTVGDSLNLSLDVWGKMKFHNASVASASNGTATLSSGTVTVSTTAVSSTSQIWVQYNGAVSTISSVLTTPVISNGVSFEIRALIPNSTSTQTTDNNVVKWRIEN